MVVRHLTKTVHHAVYLAIDPSNPSNTAVGKTVLITGGVEGIGFAMARGYSIAGVDRIIIFRRREALRKAQAKLNAENAVMGRRIETLTYRMDIKDSKAAESVFGAIRQRLNEGWEDDEPNDVDILITCAANLIQGDTILDFDTQTYCNAYVVGNLNVIRAFLAPEISAHSLHELRWQSKDISSTRPVRRQKIIVDVSSEAYVALPGQAPYNSSTLAFTRQCNRYSSRHIKWRVSRSGYIISIRERYMRQGWESSWRRRK
ncbi:hypothetical protein CC78DRAFT_621540 [Lojkania enalia]|uniref:Uncharacterized protein n=1 Tax=Lojkania enalia TaxID=147567 RepID=A0A9P4K149_9PLEO|nr:hypothetical protein CC78DRAFT_621540 [Didymosphaeria enalia]